MVEHICCMLRDYTAHKSNTVRSYAILPVPAFKIFTSHPVLIWMMGADRRGSCYFMLRTHGVFKILSIDYNQQIFTLFGRSACWMYFLSNYRFQWLFNQTRNVANSILLGIRSMIHFQKSSCQSNSFWQRRSKKWLKLMRQSFNAKPPWMSSQFKRNNM